MISVIRDIRFIRVFISYPQRIKSDSATKFRRFRNQISTIPQPKSDTLPQQKKALPLPKKKIPQPKKDDSATKTRRFRNQKQTIPQPKSARFGNQNPRHFATKICDSTLCMASSPSATLNMASSSDAVGAAAVPPQHTCCHTQHGIVFRCGGVGWGGTSFSSFDTLGVTLNMASSSDAVGWGGVGWDNNVLAAAFLPLTHLRPRSTWHRLQMRWGGVGWDNNVLAAAFPPRHTCCHTQHGVVFRCGGVGWGGVGQ